jgi:hypothetical protein
MWDPLARYQFHQRKKNPCEGARCAPPLLTVSRMSYFWDQDQSAIFLHLKYKEVCNVSNIRGGCGVLGL